MKSKIIILLFLILFISIESQSIIAQSYESKIELVLTKYEQNLRNIFALSPNSGKRTRAFQDLSNTFTKNAEAFDFLRRDKVTSISLFKTVIQDSKYRDTEFEIINSFRINPRIEISELGYKAHAIAKIVVHRDGISDNTKEISLVFFFDTKNNNDFKISGIIKIDDYDKDKYADNEDECYVKYGWIRGCPDSDGDSVPEKEINDSNLDFRDLCPGESGDPPTGCPDRDGDGINNRNDACPDDYGFKACNGCPDDDGDDICDIIEDRCPDRKGPSSTRGCPDSDGDGIPDIDDECDDEFGSKNFPMGSKCYGCPDSDGDSVCDKLDYCPNQKGPPRLNGCPDSDDDGILDKDDDCKYTKGVESRTSGCNGCPDDDEDGVCNSKDKCPNKSGSLKNGCVPTDPISNLEISITGGGSIPNLEFTGNDLYNSTLNQWNSVIGFADLGWNTDIELSYNFNPYLGLGVSTGYISFPLDKSALGGNTKLFLSRNNINYNDVEITTEAFQYFYYAISPQIGVFKKDDKFIFKINPTIGLINNNSRNSVNIIISEFNNSSSPLFYDLDLGNSLEPTLLKKIDFSLQYQVVNQKIFLGLDGSFFLSEFNLPMQSITFGNGLPILEPELIKPSSFLINVSGKLFIN